MGNTCTCFERGRWDPHPEITSDYIPRETDVYQDMTQPLSHYFISSGHNSYLTGDQLFSSSGTATIVKCLEAGCRVIELDVYNGPLCTHGGTLTSTVGFKDCIEAIRDFAFVASPYPVILTMENHTDVENQGKMAVILREVLGEKLYVPDPEDPLTGYESPESLKGKIVCRTSVKKSGDYHDDFLSLIYIRNTKCTSLADMIKKEKVTSSSFEEFVVPNVDELEGNLEQSDDKKESLDLFNRLMTQVTFKQRYEQKKLGVEPEDAVTEPGEIDAGSLRELYTYTKRHLMRVYPAMWRITSSNYNPMMAWVRGASLAALNWQVWDKALWCNEGKFLDNGGCGYVLKPDWMLEGVAKLPARESRKLVITVHSAHRHQGRNFLMFKDDLFVKLTVWGMPSDRLTQQTRTARDTGRLAVNKDFEFPIKFPEMAVLCIMLMDDDTVTSMHDALGYVSLPLATLKEGAYKLNLKRPSSGLPITSRDTWIKVTLKWEPAAVAAPDGTADAANPMYFGPPR